VGEHGTCPARFAARKRISGGSEFCRGTTTSGEEPQIPGRNQREGKSDCDLEGRLGVPGKRKPEDTESSAKVKQKKFIWRSVFDGKRENAGSIRPEGARRKEK